MRKLLISIVAALGASIGLTARAVIYPICVALPQMELPTRGYAVG